MLPNDDPYSTNNYKVDYSNKTVLVAEDVDTMRSAVSRMLDDMGFHKVIQAKDGKEAYQLISNRKVDIVIADWMMPKMSGLELLIKLRGNPDTAPLPFVMSTSVIEQAKVEQAIRAGVSEYIAKPFNFVGLQKHIEKAFLQPINERLGVRQQSDTLMARAHPDEVKPELEEREFSILVVDDIADNIRIIADVVKSQGKVQAAKTGKRALEICRSDKRPDLVLLDIMMPQMDGFEVIRKLKSDPETFDIPVIFITAKSENVDIVKGFELGAVDYITKPLSPKVLLARVNNQKRIVEYSRSISEQLDVVMENLDFKRDLDRIIHHDLKTPLTSIILSVDELAKSSYDRKRLERNIEIISSTAKLMDRMLDDLFTLTKIEDDKYEVELEPVQFRTILDSVVNGFQSKVRALGLQVDIDVEQKTKVIAQPSLLYNMLMNLFKNATEAAPRGSRIVCTGKSTEDGDMFEFSLFNLGAVPKGIRDRFFEKYVTIGKDKGTGLGTYSAKLISEVMQGSISANFKDKSTELCVSLRTVSD